MKLQVLPLLFLLFNLFYLEIDAQTFSGTNFNSLPSPLQFTATASADYDNDGDLDFIATGLDPIASTKTQIYNNSSTGFTIATSPELPNVYNGTVSWGDYDNDGKLDLVITGDSIFNDNKSAVSKIFKNTGAGFVEEFSGTLPSMHLGDAVWFDYNNDGLLDLMVTGIHPVINGTSFTDQYFTKLYKNTGNSFTEVFTGQFAPLAYSSLDVTDFNDDGFVDVIVTGSKQSGTAPLEQTSIYKNTGNGFIAVFASQIDGVSFGSIKWWDYDLDGKSDIVLCGGNSGALTTKVYRNNGTGFSQVYANSIMAGGGVIDLGDYDNDGDLDLVHIGTLSGSKFVELIRNDNSGFAAVFNNEIPGISVGIVSFGDYDGDGDLDILGMGQAATYELIGNVYVNAGGTNLFTTNQKPSPPTSLIPLVSKHDVSLSWNSGDDAETPVGALHYNIYLRKGTDTLYSAQSLKNGKRKVEDYGNLDFAKVFQLTKVPSGDYNWSVQSIDNDFQGSAFASESSFHINFPPQITQIASFTISKGDTVTLKPEDLTVTDPDNTYPVDFTIHVHDSSNYTLLGNRIIPAKNFVGKLIVPVSVYDGVDESNTFHTEVTVNNITEIDSEKRTVSVFPNPFKETLSVDFGNQEYQNSLVFITDINGQQQDVGLIKVSDTIYQSDNLKSLAQGVYILKIALGNNILVKKIIKL